jgi:hypothetical protein
MTCRPLSILVASSLAILMLEACSSNSPAAPSSQPNVSTSANAAQTARYRITFDATWRAATHPDDFPADAHFSRLVGATHTAAVRFWAEGAPSTPGIRDMAERGRTSPLDLEIQAAIGAGTAQTLLIGGAVDRSPGSAIVEFEVSQAFPLLTLVTMVAPSPDWFVGVAGVPIFANGVWMAEQRIDLVPWDAGTDSGTTFTSPDVATSPFQTVSRILTAPLSPGGRVTPLGTFTVARVG